LNSSHQRLASSPLTLPRPPRIATRSEFDYDAATNRTISEVRTET